MDPFPPTCDPAAYVPRAATEALLSALDDAFAAARPLVTVSGPAGLGKTMLLRVAETRWSGAARCLHLPYASLSTADLACWVLGLLGEAPTDAAAAEARLLALAGEGDPLVLLLDDASALPPATARDVAGWVHALGGALRVVLALVDDERSGRVLATLGEATALRLAEPMSETETRSYVAARLDPVWPVGRDLFTPELVGWLHRASGGIPRLLHMLATWKQYSDAPLPGTDWAPGGESWLETGDTADFEAPEPHREAVRTAGPVRGAPPRRPATDPGAGFQRRRRRRQRR